VSGDELCHWHSVGFVESDDGWSCPMCPRPPDVDQLRADLTAARAEIERLRAAGERLHSALTPLSISGMVVDMQELCDAFKEARRER
jgi:hypothetical protein